MELFLEAKFCDIYIVATFFNVAGKKLGFWTFAKVLIENDKVVDFFRVFSNKILSKTVPEYDTAIEHLEESNKEGKLLRKN